MFVFPSLMRIVSYQPCHPFLNELFLFVTPSDDLRFSTNTAITDSTPVKRSRLVGVALTHHGNVGVPAAKVSINLFDDTVYTATHMRSETVSNGFLWIGRLDDIDLSQAVFIVSDDMITGSISFPGANYTISALLMKVCQNKQEVLFMRNLRLPPRHFHPSRGYYTESRLISRLPGLVSYSIKTTTDERL